MQTTQAILAPNKLYEKFFIKMNEFENLPIEQWDHNQLVGYFCNRYYKLYNKQYKFKFDKSQPSSCYEIYNMKAVQINLSKDPKTLKSYIDWIFDFHAIKRKRKITKIGFIKTEEIINEFKTLTLMNEDSKIERSTELPDFVKNQIAMIMNKDIKSYGELAFLKQMDTPETNKLFIKLSELKFNTDLLDMVV